MRAAIATCAFALAMLAGTPPEASADSSEVVRRSMRFAERGGKLVVSGSYSDLWTRDALDKLSKGVVHTIVARIYVYREDDQEIPVSFVLAQARIVYDLWDEIYQVQLTGPLGKKRVRFRRRTDALAAVSRLDALALAPLTRIAVGPNYIMIAVIELNPVSEALRAEMRRWISQGGDAKLDSGSSFFGSVVSVFVNAKSPEADSVLRLRSQPFYRQRATGGGR